MAEAGDVSGHTPLTPDWTPAPRASHYPWQGDRPAAAPSLITFSLFFNVRDVFLMCFFSIFACYSAAFCQLCFYNKDWIGLDCAILRENRLRGLTSRAVRGKKESRTPIGMMCRR